MSEIVGHCLRCGSPICGPKETNSTAYIQRPCQCPPNENSSGFVTGFVTAIMFIGLVLATIAITLAHR